MAKQTVKLTSQYVAEQLWEVYSPYVEDVAVKENISKTWFTQKELCNIVEKNRTKDAATIVESIASYMDERLANRDWLSWQELADKVGFEWSTPGNHANMIWDESEEKMRVLREKREELEKRAASDR